MIEASVKLDHCLCNATPPRFDDKWFCFVLFVALIKTYLNDLLKSKSALLYMAMRGIYKEFKSINKPGQILCYLSYFLSEKKIAFRNSK
jgi:hypothetical protein